MVQSIWLQFDKEQRSPEVISAIIDTVKKCYKTYSYVDEKHLNKFHFRPIDCSQIREISKNLNLSIDDTKQCSCGCHSTDFETVVYFLDLEFYYGNIYDVDYFDLGKNCYMDIGMYKERFWILRHILEDIQSKLPDNIKSTLDFGDIDKDTFEGYKRSDKKVTLKGND